MQIERNVVVAVETACWNARVLLCRVPVPWRKELADTVASLAELGDLLRLELEEQEEEGQDSAGEAAARPSRRVAAYGGGIFYRGPRREHGA
jgi:hypothetical protein